MPKIIGESLASHRELTRARLFEALGSLMGEQSFESITMSQIAERAGVGRTAVYNHFADKEVLLLAYMRQVTEEFARVLTQRLEAEPDPLMRLRIYIRSHLQMIGRYHVKAGMGLRRQMSGQGASHLHDHAGLVGELLIGILDEAMERGLIAEQPRRGSPDPRDAAGAAPPQGSGASRVGARPGRDLYFARPGRFRGKRAAGHCVCSPFGGIEGALRPLNKKVHARPHGPAPTTVG